MKKTFKGLMVVAFAFILLLSLTGCGEQKENNGGGNGTQGGNQQQEQGGNQEQEIDLSQFTAVEFKPSDLLEEWMKPNFGVVTSSSEMLNGYYYTFTISGVTKANEESYRSLIESNGWTESSSVSYKKDNKEIALGNSAVGKTKESIMTVTITKE